MVLYFHTIEPPYLQGFIIGLHLFIFPPHMCHVWTRPSLFTQHALLQQSASDGAADVGGKRVAGNTKMDETI